MASQPTLDGAVPFVPWDEFTGRHFAWKQGQHLTMLGPTDAGKTTFLRAILPPALPHRRRVVIVATKPADASLDRFLKAGYTRVEKWPPPGLVDNVIFWPKFRKMDDRKTQAEAIGKALRSIFADRGQWCVVLDELHYLTKFLGLTDEVETLLHQGRSVGLTVVSGTQRPAHVPLVTYSSAKWLVIFRTSDGRDLLRLSEFAGVDSRLVRWALVRLPEHEALVVSSSELLRTKVSL